MKASGNPGCAWCGNPIVSAASAGLVRAREYGGHGVWQARFHPRCAEAIIEICHRRTIAPQAKDLAEIDAAAIHEPAPTRPPKPRRRRIAAAPDPAAPPPGFTVAAGTRLACILELAARGVPENQIAARLRAPYATIRAVLEVA